MYDSLASSSHDVYVLASGLLFTTLVLWYAAPRSAWLARLAPLVIAAAGIGMLGGLTLVQGEPSDKFFILARDLLIQAALAYVVRMLAKRPELLAAALAALLAVWWFGYRKVQAESLEALGALGTPAGTQVGVSDAGAMNSPEFLLYANSAAEATKLVDGFGREAEAQIVKAFENVDSEYEGASFLNALYAVDANDDWAAAHVNEVTLGSGTYVEFNETFDIPQVVAKPQQRQVRGPDPASVGLNDPEVTQQWALSAWPYAAFAKTTQHVRSRLQPAKLFVLDSGVDALHPDLAGNYSSYDVKHDRDGLGHGTHVAGIAAAVANNGLGTAGWLPPGSHDITVSSIRVIGPFGIATQRSVVQGIIDAANAGAAVINLSLGGPSSDNKQRIYAEAVRYANEHGCIVVVAAGNSGSDAKRYAPANTPGVIAVAALDNTLQQASFSNDITGLDLGVWAPGKDIYSTVPNGGYTMFSGTSMAAPQVAGLLTVAKAIRPSLTTVQAYNLLNDASRDASAQATSAVKLIDPERVLRGLD